MPCVDFYSKTDYVSIHYVTNSPHCNVGGFDPEKPSVVILHPIFLDSTWADSQLGDPRLNDNFNLIAFDMRTCGQSTCRPSGRHDTWVDAADLGLCFQRLHLPPSHFLALEGSAIYCALRFAILFPELCLSLTLVNVPPTVELKWIYRNIDELVHGACFPESLEKFERRTFDLMEFLFGPGTDPDLVDDLISHWESIYPPPRRVYAVETTNVYLNRAPLTSETYASIEQPVLIIQGEKNELCPMKFAERLMEQLTGVEGGAILYEVKGGTSMISVVPGCASIVNNVFYKFLNRLPHHRSDIEPPAMPLKERMRIALNKLSEINGQDTTGLDPLSAISFSCLNAEVIKAQISIIEHYLKDSSQAFSPHPEGRARRRNTQKERVEWSYFEKGKSTIVHTGDPSSAPERVKQQQQMQQPQPQSQPQPLEGERSQRSSTRSELTQAPLNDTTSLAKGYLVMTPGPTDKTTANVKKSRKAMDSSSAASPMHRMLAAPF